VGQHTDPAIRETLGMEAQPCAYARKRKLDDRRQDDRLKYLVPRRGQDIEPGVADEKRRRRGGGKRQVPGPAEREVARRAKRY
jgi:hypothetical protein